VITKGGVKPWGGRFTAAQGKGTPGKRGGGIGLKPRTIKRRFKRGMPCVTPHRPHHWGDKKIKKGEGLRNATTERGQEEAETRKENPQLEGKIIQTVIAHAADRS